MKRKIRSSTVLLIALFTIESAFSVEDYMEDTEESQVEAPAPAPGEKAPTQDEENNMPPPMKATRPKKEKASTLSNSHRKNIEVNSVNFIKLKEPASEVFVPNPEVADVNVLNETSLYLTGVKPGLTSLVVHNKQGEIIADYQIRVTYPLDEMRRAIKELHPDAQVEIASMDDAIILKGRAASPEDASDIQTVVSHFAGDGKIINKMNITTATQVLLKVKIAEVSRTVTKSLGINWRALSMPKSNAGPMYSYMSGNTKDFLEHVSSSEELKKEAFKKDSVLSTSISGGRWFIRGGGENNNISALLDALASETYASLLAEPTLIAVSGQTAKFTSGGEYAYIVKQDSSDSNTAEFKEWGTTLEFTPTVISEDRIIINVKPKVSNISGKADDGTPSLATKEVETTVELGSGQSLAIAGLLQLNKNSNSTETPLLADLPLIGSLFRTSAVSTDEKEIVVIITPYIVKPSSGPLLTPIAMTPKLCSPLDSILKRRFHARHKKSGGRGSLGKVDAAGFSI